ncbi:MAG: prolipoprotein diacylglyceryl transferase [Clostridia bacterium]|nr:prolipoprotein diacylglyceryl transferase [Clostridia bacterium]
MKNELITIGPFTLYGYGLMIAIGIVSAFLVAEHRAKKLKLDHERVLSLSLWAVFGGVVGAKLLYYITTIKEIIADPKLLLDVADGFVIYGGIIGGILAALIYCKRAKLDTLKYFDLAIPSVALAQGFGRIGCFLAGCCYGRETKSLFRIIFHDSAFAPNNVPLIPTQLISSGLDFLHFFVLILFAKYKKADGHVTGLYLMLYSLGRFILEFYRGDLIRGSVGSLSTSQFISLFMAAFGMIIFAAATRKARISAKNEQAA